MLGLSDIQLLLELDVPSHRLEPVQLLKVLQVVRVHPIRVHHPQSVVLIALCVQHLEAALIPLLVNLKQLGSDCRVEDGWLEHSGESEVGETALKDFFVDVPALLLS